MAFNYSLQQDCFWRWVLGVSGGLLKIRAFLFFPRKVAKALFGGLEICGVRCSSRGETCGVKTCEVSPAAGVLAVRTRSPLLLKSSRRRPGLAGRPVALSS